MFQKDFDARRFQCKAQEVLKLKNIQKMQKLIVQDPELYKSYMQRVGVNK